MDGPRTVPPADIAPGEARRFDLQLELPPEPGRYRVFLSAMQEHSHWFYERGAEFLLVDAVVDDGPREHGEISRDYRALGAAASGCCARSRRAFTLPFETIVRNRSLIRTMVRRDVLGRYRGSFGGALLDRAESAHPDADVLLRVRRGAADTISQRPQPLRLRALLSGGHAALARGQRSRRTRAHSHAGTSQFRQEAGVPGGNAAHSTW